MAVWCQLSRSQMDKIPAKSVREVTPSLVLLLGQLFKGTVVHTRVLSMGEIVLFENYLY